jgi:hypothetical protein
MGGLFHSAFCCWGVRSSRAGFYFSFHEKREVNKRNSPAGCSEAKIGCFFPKSTKRSHFVALNGGRFFTEKSTQFLYASPQRPELIIFICRHIYVSFRD